MRVARPQHTIRAMKSTRIRWMEHVAYMYEMSKCTLHLKIRKLDFKNLRMNRRVTGCMWLRKELLEGSREDLMYHPVP